MKWLWVGLLVLLLATPGVAASGHVQGDYDLMTKQWFGTVEVSQALRSIDVGVTLRTLAPEYGYKFVFPSWIPSMQSYEMWAEGDVGPLVVRLTDWCNHWLTQSGRTWQDDSWGLRVSVRYEF